MTDKQDQNGATEDDHPGVIMHPPVLYLLFLLASLGIEYFRSWPVVDASQAVQLGTPLAGAGVLICLICIVNFRKSGTNVPTNKPATTVVTGGLYRFSRNPIYLGLTLFYLGLCVLLNTTWGFVLAMPLLALMNSGVIAREEAYLEKKFGDEYLQYKARVRRWI